MSDGHVLDGPSLRLLTPVCGNEVRVDGSPIRGVQVLNRAVVYGGRGVILFGLFILYIYLFIVRVIKSRRMRWAGHVARMGEERGAYRVLVGKPEGKRSLGRSRCRWVDNIRMDLQEVGCGYGDWIGLA